MGVESIITFSKEMSLTANEHGAKIQRSCKLTDARRDAHA